MPDRPLRIGMSARLLHRVPQEMGFRNKTLQYLEQSMAHWIMSHGALAFMVPTLGWDAEVERRRVSVRDCVDALDGLVLQGGADVSPSTYGQQPLLPSWAGDAIRDRYEIELIDGFMSMGKPIFGVCRGMQLLNVALGGTLYQDIATQRPEAQLHVDADAYDQHTHDIVIESDSSLAMLYPSVRQARVNSIHHQAVDQLGADLTVEARSADDGMIEAIRARGSTFAMGVQWHPEFHQPDAGLLDSTPLLRLFLQAARQRSAQLSSP